MRTPRAQVLLTYVSPPRFDDYSAPAASLLFCLCHALPCLLVGIVSSTHSDFILYASKAIQMDIAIAAKERQWKRHSQHCKWEHLCHWRVTEVVLSKHRRGQKEVEKEQVLLRVPPDPKYTETH